MSDRPCTLCGKAAPEVEFRMRTRPNGRQVRHSWCVTCVRESNKLAERKRRQARGPDPLAEVTALSKKLTEAVARLRRRMR